MKKNFIILNLILFIAISCHPIKNDMIKNDFCKKYPDFQYIEHFVGEGDMSVVYITVKYNKPDLDSIFKEEWQYWNTRKGWIIREQFKSEPIKTKFFNLLDQNNYESINFKEITKKDWNKITFLQPYTDLGKFSLKTGIDIREIKKVGIEYRDDITIVLFIFNHIIVEYFLCPRNIDFSEFSDSTITDSTFELIDTKRELIDGQRIYRLINKSGI
jgi:hypothetical protein